VADINEYIEQLQEFDFNDIDWERIGVWPAPAKIFVCVLAFILILIGCHFLFVKDLNSSLLSAETKERTLKASFESKAFQAANLDRYRAQMEEMSGSLIALINRLPSDTEVPGLLEDITDKRIEAGLHDKGIILQDEVSTEFHIELPIKINVTGGYHEFGAFVSGVAGMPRIVTLHDFSILKSKSQTGLLTMEIIAKTYRYKPQE